MIMSNKLTPERIAEILAWQDEYDEDCPELTDEQIARLRPARQFFEQGEQKAVSREYYENRKLYT